MQDLGKQPQWSFFPALNYEKMEPYGTTYGLMNSWRDHRNFRPMSRSYNVSNDVPMFGGNAARPFSRTDMGVYQSGSQPFLQRSATFGPGDMKESYSRFHKKGMNPSFPLFGTPRMRYGRAGGSWRHVKEVVQARGPNTIFVDGNPKMDDNNRIVYKDVEYGNVIQPAASCKLPVGVAGPSPPPPRQRSPVYMSPCISVKGLDPVQFHFHIPLRIKCQHNNPQSRPKPSDQIRMTQNMQSIASKDLKGTTG